jgi:hypothetical protein
MTGSAGVHCYGWGGDIVCGVNVMFIIVDIAC